MVSIGWVKNLLIAPEMRPERKETDTILSYQVFYSLI